MLLQVAQHLRHLFRVAYYSRQLRGNLQLKPSVLRRMQNKRLRAIVKHAYDNVPFYHKKFEDAGIKPNDIKSIGDLHKIPLTTKLEIQVQKFEDIVARNIDLNSLVRQQQAAPRGFL